MQRPYWSGERSRLRPHSTPDWETLYREEADAAGIRSLEPGMKLPRTPEQVKEWVAWAAEQRGQGEFIPLAIESRAGEFVGTVNLHERNSQHGTFSYAVRIFRPYRRQGYALEAVRLLLRYAFFELRMQKANATTVAFNQGSIRLQLALGFQEEGRRRRMVYTDGNYFDELLFGMTREEFEATIRAAAVASDSGSSEAGPGPAAGPRPEQRGGDHER